MDSLFTFFNKFNLPSCLKGKMPEIHLGTHTIKSHGVMLARLHMLDWFILLFLGAVEVILYMIHPFHRFVGIYMIEDLKYPLKDSTVPFWVVPLIAVLLPMVIFLSYYFYRRNVYDLHHATLGLLFSILITGVITDAIKDGIGSPRPDFYWRCFPDGIPKFDPITGNVICNGKRSVIDEGHKSFPSGHTSWSFAGLSFLALYLSGKVRLFDHGGHVAKLCVSFLPLLIAAFVGISQADDYQHHWRDVFAGGILGTTIATFCYLQFFPAPYDMDGWGPYAYFQMLADSRTSLRQSATASGLTVRPTASMRAYHRAERDEEMGEIIAADSSRSTVDAS